MSYYNKQSDISSLEEEIRDKKNELRNILNIMDHVHGENKKACWNRSKQLTQEIEQLKHNLRGLERQSFFDAAQSSSGTRYM